MKKTLDECTREKHGAKAGQRSASRVALITGLIVFGFILVQAQVIVVGVLADWWEWSAVSGYFSWVGTFAGGTVIPYAAKHIIGWKGPSP